MLAKVIGYGRGRTVAGTGAARRPGPRRDHQPEPVERAGQSVYVHGPGSSTEVTRLTAPAASIQAGSLIAPMPAMVITVSSTMPGDSVAAGQPLIVLEAMKMQHAVLAR
jgi:biotin carboxyl carrier protein